MGIYRQWWENNENDIYIIHDPGLERIIRFPTFFHLELHEEAFEKPVTFVEDFGENIDYIDNCFDYIVLAETLNYVINPKMVLEKAFNLLKKNGHIIVINHVESKGMEINRFKNKLIKEIKIPKVF